MKLMSAHNFENNVQQKMGELKLVPSEAVWKNVEGNIRQQKRRRRVIFFLSFILLVGLAGGSLLLQNDTLNTVQTIEKSWNPRFYKLVEAFEKESGIAVVLNTSLNRKGMPIVETPAQALQLFKETALDILVVEDTVLEKRV